ncbi:unnamed protein product [Peronospora farinosa]|uniref:Non-canonical E2 ubiquitin-conjugating enzyme C-terminal domain-containing protein n=2 Tax=Peronospora farinosa TaxID=134698 RepID=A0ABN8BT43_9STRA|nr:unnamed protein product [Peronospora farinosa]
MHVILHSTMRSLDSWVGSSVIRFGDKNVPTRSCSSTSTPRHHVRWGSHAEAHYSGKLLSPSFRRQRSGQFFSRLDHALMDDLRASAWNWCSNLHTKPFFPNFKITGFVGFDDKFG